MLRARLLTALVFNLVLAAWVWHDARCRGGRKPLFAAALSLAWGPLGLGVWLADRPLARSESRRGTAPAVARGFLAGWAALLPAMCVMTFQAVEHRAAIPTALGREIGLLPATALAVSMLWGVPALLAIALGRLGRSAPAASVDPAAAATSAPAWVASAIAGAAALATALAFQASG